MAPAANPRPADCQGSKCSTNMKTGTATTGCGREEQTAHARVLSGETLRHRGHKHDPRLQPCLLQDRRNMYGK